eukprot:CAMPEP_0174271520 /NCGR_PEP_ID=MMETSP0439-20130205/48156_1 /TAXON_ID=0 /ORGANISM="Stereomyxa ramosa, Strain Chinc5" /LENGTH=105 /DNA_ID=CAMNT_0015361569 /DNA_START=245 /DNA_END=559 /DNA_ORIENTATION=-
MKKLKGVKSKIELLRSRLFPDLTVETYGKLSPPNIPHYEFLKDDQVVLCDCLDVAQYVELAPISMSSFEYLDDLNSRHQEAFQFLEEVTDVNMFCISDVFDDRRS